MLVQSPPTQCPKLERGDTDRKIMLSVSPFGQDHEALRLLLPRQKWIVGRSSSLALAKDRLREDPDVAVVVCEASSSPGSWKELLAVTRRMQPSPLLIVTSEHADEHLWSKVLNLGGYDVLVKPFDGEEVTRVLTSAAMRWKGQRSHARA